MIELPEAITLSNQVSSNLAGKTIAKVHQATSLHKFTFFNGDPLAYCNLLEGKKIKSAVGKGIFVDLFLNKNTTISINDGVNIRYHILSKAPVKYQLMLEFDDKTCLTFTVVMYGGIFAYQGKFENDYHKKSISSISPISDSFDESYFHKLFDKESKNISVKALLATEQRIPGLGNGVLQDILFNAGINPKRKIQSLSNKEKLVLFQSLKKTLQLMVSLGGRDTETDLLGHKGSYKTMLSKNTYKHPCPQCKNSLIKEAYLGGSVYYCPCCQPL